MAQQICATIYFSRGLNGQTEVWINILLVFGTLASTEICCVTVCSRSSGPSEKIFNIFASENEV